MSDSRSEIIKGIAESAERLANLLKIFPVEILETRQARFDLIDQLEMTADFMRKYKDDKR